MKDLLRTYLEFRSARFSELGRESLKTLCQYRKKSRSLRNQAMAPFITERLASLLNFGNARNKLTCQ
jgi:hypothetical protein